MNKEQPTIVLVTGANGQLGQCIKDLENQYANLNLIYTDYQDLDICDLSQVEAFFQMQDKIDYCVNCAAYTAVDKAEEEAEKAYGINAVGPKNLAVVCQKQGVVLIHISTDFVFDGTKKEPYTETDEPNPINVYGVTKLQGEKEIQQTLETYFILRTSWLYSEYGHNFMKTMLQLAETQDEISVVNDQIGTPTYAGDLAEVILKMIQNKFELYGVYHYSNEGMVSWYDFAKAIFHVTKANIILKGIATKDYRTLAQRPPYSVLDKGKIKTCLKIRIHDWKDRLPRALAALRAIEQ